MRRIGLELGHCAVEQAERESAARPLLEFIRAAYWFDHSEIMQRIHLFLDALLYHRRALRWGNVAFAAAIGQPHPWYTEPALVRASLRYQWAGMQRVLKRGRDLGAILDQPYRARLGSGPPGIPA